MTTFSTETHHNEYLPAGGAEIHAIVSVTASGSAMSAAAPAPTAAEIIIIDVSGSMGRRKLAAAKQATATAIDSIRDGVLFGVVAGNHKASCIYPLETSLVPASANTRVKAKAAVRQLKARGGTAIGSWLLEANDLFPCDPGMIRHAILLTDGQNQNEAPDKLDRALARCESRFQCDCRGVGTDWRVAELRKIASRLLGTVDIIPDPTDMQADFQEMMQQSMRKVTNDVALRVWTPAGATVAFFRQVAPAIEDLTARRAVVSELVGDYPTGAWGDEARDYHLCITFPARAAGDEMLVGRVSLVVDGEAVSQALIRAVWTDDLAVSTKTVSELEGYVGQQELAVSIQAGLAARKDGDEEAATVKLGHAVQLAVETGNDATLKLLARVVDIQDAPTGTVRLKRQVDAVDEMRLDTRSMKTARISLGS